ncbi:MAG: valine--tRNA ligase [Candidatus Omnitrophica bacterium]|nr:valine--tRNA ligase [Candidatus Omnitrophota bacterium]MBU4590065.1 valine--tRNA ligase [Candidatus Omnitrophota bacterium]
MKDIPSRYNPQEVEKKIYRRWQDEGLFGAEASSRKKPFTIVIPPPNVTGILHMGHALNNTLQDILIRWKRMQGFASLWVPGTDHAGIATQNVVEKKLATSGKSRDDLGREKFIDEVWKWREEYGSTIIEQLKRLGSSCDWQRTRFTMDEGLSQAVLEAFIKLHKKGLIYRGNYIINWCPRCHTALSDEEAPHVDTEGKLYYIKYPLKEGEECRVKGEGVVVATTRPETMLGDVAVAVNPKDKRYKKLVGKTLILPIIGREIEIVADSFVDREFGTGAVKVTPAHDPNDFEMGKRHSLDPVLVMNSDATMNENAGAYKGMDRFEARAGILKELEEKGLLVKTEKHQHAVGHCYRCHTAVEPYLSLQWFVNMKELAKPAIEAVKKGKIKFTPKRWTKVYLNWMENIRDWCISRQIWWGHRIPVYYCEICKEVIVAKVKPETCPECGSTRIRQDEDVLDTWFSSWLWPFSTLGWPEKTKDLEYFYPTDVLVTAPEILFFWVARMIMAGLEFTGEIPFSDVYLHGTVRDLTGKKMSKSLGNIIDPLDIINEFGADALRYSMIVITATGQDVFLSKEKFEIGRNFANKIWNASRFVLMNVQGLALNKRCSRLSLEHLADEWILSRLNRAVEAVTKSLGQYRFNEAEALVYDFFWHDFCDWYVEMVKPEIAGGVKGQVLLDVLESSLKLLHPFMPFVTEAVWQNIDERHSIMQEAWPRPDKKLVKKDIEERVETIKSIIVSIRNIRADMNIPHSKRLVVYLVPLKKASEAKLKGGIDYIKNLARLDELVIDKDMKRPEACATAVLEDFNIFIPLKGVIDIDAERSRLTKKMQDAKAQLSFSDRRLKDKNFTARAPEKIVAQEKDKAEKLGEQITRLKSTLNTLI